MNVSLVSITQPFSDLNVAEDIIAYCARVSNPSNQKNAETAPKLLKFLQPIFDKLMKKWFVDVWEEDMPMRERRFKAQKTGRKKPPKQHRSV